MGRWLDGEMAGWGDGCMVTHWDKITVNQDTGSIPTSSIRLTQLSTP